MLRLITLILVIIGGLNWGLWGAFRLDLVAEFANLFGSRVVGDLVYVVVGLSALAQVFMIEPPKTES